ncbi:hypothetical protein Tcan_05239 [Toxocara canis]|uniref:Uncharacterized protein n=1 Tax=Toxocara canis TaxID=6265 RepID=A0A0B2V3V1_TOXCA|nr:hypothetical protein Tcan_05239 [Toxocara canis]
MVIASLNMIISHLRKAVWIARLCVCTIFAIVYIAIFVLSLLGLEAVIDYFRNITKRDERRHQFQELVATILYIIPPTISHSPFFITSIATLLRQFDESNETLLYIISRSLDASLICSAITPVLLSLSTLVALPPYRNVMLQIFRRTWKQTVGKLQLTSIAYMKNLCVSCNFTERFLRSNHEPSLNRSLQNRVYPL